MRQIRYRVVMAVVGAMLSGVLSSAFAGPVEDAEKIARCMRELQGRYIYLKIGGQGVYRDWNSSYGSLTLCGNLQTPYYPPNEWYAFELKEHPNPAGRAKELVEYCVFQTFITIHNCFVRDEYWDLEGKSAGSDTLNYRIQDFPDLIWVDEGPLYSWLTVTENNYRQILDALEEAIFNKLKVIQNDPFVLSTIEESDRMGIGFQYPSGSEPVISCWSTCDISCRGWACPHREWESYLENTSWYNHGGSHYCDTDSCECGILERIHYFTSGGNLYLDYLVKSRRFKVRADLSNYPSGSAQIYMMIQDSDESTNDGGSFSNLHGLQALDRKWQKIAETACNQEWVSDYYANDAPQYTIGIIATPSENCSDYGKGWAFFNSIVLIEPVFENQADTGIFFQPAEEEIYKQKDDLIVYTIHPKCVQDPNDGEVIDILVPCPWEIPQGTRLSALVRVTSKDTKEIAYVSAGGWDKTGIPLEIPEQVACIAKGPCSGSGCGPTLWDEATQSYRLKVSVVGKKGGPKDFQFKVALWYQTGTTWESNLDTRCAEKEFTFTATPNHYSCCAREDECSNDHCLFKSFEPPQVTKMKNDDVQVEFPEQKETYIFQRPRPGFIHDLTLSEHDAQNPLNLIDSDQTQVSLNSAVVLRYEGGMGLVYNVPSTWWNASEPTGNGEFLYVIDEDGNIFREIDLDEYEDNGKTGQRLTISESDGSGKIEYYYDPDYPDRISKIRSYDLTGYSETYRERSVSYDTTGRITYISEGSGGCSSCSGGSDGKVYTYDTHGNVLQEKNAEDVVLYEFDYDTKNRMIAKWYGLKSEGQLAEEVVYSDSSSGTVATRYRYTDESNYRLEVDHFDMFGKLCRRIRYEKMNENPQSPTGRFFVETYKVWPPSDSDPSIQAYWKLDEESGGWGLDSSIYGHHGLLRNYGSSYNYWEAGILNNALEFVQNWVAPSYVQVQDYYGVASDHPRTVSVWIKPSAAGRVIRWGGDSAGENWEIRVEDTGKLAIDIGSANIKIDNMNFLNPVAWRHVAVVLKDSTSPKLSDISIFVDGELPENVTYTNPTQIVQTSVTDEVTLGGTYVVGATNYDFLGHIDEVMIFDRALSPQEIDQLRDYQLRNQNGEYTETVVSITPKFSKDDIGPRNETVRTYKKHNESGQWYLFKTQENRYGFEGNYIPLNTSEYEAILDDGALATHLKKSIQQGAETTYEYDTSNVIRIRNEKQPQVESLTETFQLNRWYDYDALGRIKEDREHIEQYNGTPPSTFLVARHYQYDNRGNLVKQHLRDGKSPTVEEQVLENKYNGFNEEVCSKSAEGIVKGREYDGYGRLIADFVYANPADWQLTPASYRQKLSLSLSEENRLQVLSLTRYSYDSLGRLLFTYRAKAKEAFAYCSVEYPATGVSWATTEYGYDNYGNRTTVKQYVEGLSSPLITVYSYNRLGEQDRVVHPNSRYQRTIRDGRGFVTQEIAGHIDEFDQEEPMSVTSYLYDENGNLKIAVNSDDSRIENIYDEYDRIKRVYRGVVAPPSQP